MSYIFVEVFLQLFFLDFSQPETSTKTAPFINATTDPYREKKKKSHRLEKETPSLLPAANLFSTNLAIQDCSLLLLCAIG